MTDPRRHTRRVEGSRIDAGRRAFTLIELLVMIAIVTVLLGLLLGAVQMARAAAARTQCADRLRQLGLGLHAYLSTHETFPPGVSVTADGGKRLLMNWHTRLLPYLEQEGLWKQSLTAYVAQPYPQDAHPYSILQPAFECPADPRSGRVFLGEPRPGTFWPYAPTSYLGVQGTNYSRKDGILFTDSRVRMADITDGASQTLLVGERPSYISFGLGAWYAGEGQVGGTGAGNAVLGALERCYSAHMPDCAVGPYEFGPGRAANPCDAFHFWSNHAGGANFAFADGSVRFLAYGAAPILPALATRAGGEEESPPP